MQNEGFLGFFCKNFQRCLLAVSLVWKSVQRVTKLNKASGSQEAQTSVSFRRVLFQDRMDIWQEIEARVTSDNDLPVAGTANKVGDSCRAADKRARCAATTTVFSGL